jgi:hypothetical protein
VDAGRVIRAGYSEAEACQHHRTFDHACSPVSSIQSNRKLSICRPEYYKTESMTGANKTSFV